MGRMVASPQPTIKTILQAPLYAGTGTSGSSHCLLYCAVVVIIPCCAISQVTELWQFFLVRMLTGISVGGCFPLVFSLLGDLFPVSQRAAMSAIVQIAVGGGIGGGQVRCRSLCHAVHVAALVCHCVGCTCHGRGHWWRPSELQLLV